MISLEKFFENLFADKNITDPRLSTFGKSNISSMQGKNPGGIYDTNISETNTKVTALDETLSDKSSNASTSKGGTANKNEARKNCQDFISQKEGLIKSLFGKKSGKYIEFYPQGITGFKASSDAEFETKMDVYVGKAVKYSTEVGATFVTNVTALSNAFGTKRDDHIDDNSSVATARSDEESASLALQLQLTANVLDVAKHNIGNPKAAKLYFNTPLLFSASHQYIFNVVLKPNETLLIFEHKLKAEDTLKFTITGTAEGKAYLSDSKEVANGTGLDIAANAVTFINVTDWATDLETHRWLFIQNIRPVDMSVKVEVL